MTEGKLIKGKYGWSLYEKSYIYPKSLPTFVLRGRFGESPFKTKKEALEFAKSVGIRVKRERILKKVM